MSRFRINRGDKNAQGYTHHTYSLPVWSTPLVEDDLHRRAPPGPAKCSFEFHSESSTKSLLKRKKTCPISSPSQSNPNDESMFLRISSNCREKNECPYKIQFRCIRLFTPKLTKQYKYQARGIWSSFQTVTDITVHSYLLWITVEEFNTVLLQTTFISYDDLRSRIVES